jgi:hypothetical protein
MKKISNSKIVKSFKVLKNTAKNTSVIDVTKDLKFFTDRAIKNNNGKRDIFLRYVLSLSLKDLKKPFKKSSISILKDKLFSVGGKGYEKEDTFFASGLAYKVSTTAKEIRKDLKDLRIEEIKKEIVEGNKKAVVSEVGFSLVS